MTTLTKDATVFVQAVVDRLNENAVPGILKKVTYGAQEMIESTPQAACENLVKQRDISGTQKFEISFRVGIMLYIEKLQDASMTKKEVEQLAETIEDVLKTPERKFGGLVIFSYVARVDYGIATIGGVMMRSARLVLEALTQEVGF